MFKFNIFALPPLFSALLIFSLGIYVWTKNIKSATNFSWFLVTISMFVWLISDFFLYLTTEKSLAIIFSKLVYVGVTALPMTVLCFARGVTKLQTKKWFFVLLFFVYLFVTLVAAGTNYCIDGVYYFFWGFYPKAGKYHSIYLIFWFSFFVLSVYTIIKKALNFSVPKDEKNRLLYVFWLFIAGGVVGPLDFIQKYGIEFYPVGYFSVLIMVSIMTFAILKHNLLDIKIVFKKGILYSLIIASLTGVYLLLIMLVEWAFRGLIGYKSLVISLSAAFAMTLLFIPLKNRIQSLIDKLFLGKTPQEIALENERLKQELEGSERLKAASTLALGLCHEIKNPLTTLKTFSEYLPQKFEDKAFLEKFAKLIPEEVERINSIVHQLLDFSKPAPPSFKDVPIHNLIHGILELLSNDFLKRKIRINEYFDDINLIIKTDPAQLKQALLNIILNAMDAMPHGGNITITTMLRQDNYLGIEITDNGCGIAEKDLKHIFDPFFSTKESGTGLGLSIAHQIIKNHKGKIEVESELGKGTTFRISLPLTQQLEG